MPELQVHVLLPYYLQLAEGDYQSEHCVPARFSGLAAQRCRPALEGGLSEDTKHS